MRIRSLLAGAALAVTCTALTTALAQKREAALDKGVEKSAPPAAPLLPGVRADGFIQMPNQWSLRPAGKQVELGDFPVNLALHPSGRWLAAIHSGYGEHEVMIVDLKTTRVVSRVNLDQTFYGLCFAPDGSKLYASGGEFEIVHALDFDEGLLGKRQRLVVAPATDKFVPGGMTISSNGKTLFIAGTWGDAVSILPVAEPAKNHKVTLGKESYPYTCLLAPDGKRLYVSLWGQAAVAVVDLAERKVVERWNTERHPTEMALTRDGKHLFVACANSTRVSVLETEGGKALETIACSLHPDAPNGNTPNSLCLTPDGELLFVSNADANNVAVFNVAKPGRAQALGFLPVGWYPTSVRYNESDRKIYVANGRGTTPKANPQGPNPNLPDNPTVRQYIAGLYRGTLGIIDMPSPARLAAYSKTAYACSPLRKDQAPPVEPDKDNPIPRKLGESSPIKHCIYIIKENRTYDQVFGDMKQGNGDPNLCIFGEKVTPNHHRLAQQFVLLDNFYVEGEVSASGHEWSMGAYCSDFVQKAWPLSYRGSPLRKLASYPAEGHFDAMARPAGGYLWDRAAEAGIGYMSFGEWIENGRTPEDPGKARVKALEGHFDPKFRGFDMDYPDVKRAERFIAEFKRFEDKGEMPQLIILRLPNDHTSGTRVGKPTPTAYLADNDLALGMVVSRVSKSKFWKDTAIFVIEDDAQNGSDHVDAHRTVALVVSPYTKRGHVDSSLYSTSSMLRTMELILGLKPMSQFDAAARPMYASFQAKPDLRPYDHVVPDVNLEEKNVAGAWGAKISEGFDLTKEDAADDLLLNEVIWRSVRGADSRMPPPVRAAFIVPVPKRDDDDD
jgi:DNA-binding beta-propeller fold protein YncE